MQITTNVDNKSLILNIGKAEDATLLLSILEAGRTTIKDDTQDSVSALAQLDYLQSGIQSILEKIISENTPIEIGTVVQYRSKNGGFLRYPRRGVVIGFTLNGDVIVEATGFTDNNTFLNSQVAGGIEIIRDLKSLKVIQTEKQESDQNAD